LCGIAGLNILGIKENARFTFRIFFIVALVLPRPARFRPL
jgi:hypothetical protein